MIHVSEYIPWYPNIHTRRTYQKTLNCTNTVKSELGLANEFSALKTLKQTNANRIWIKDPSSFLLENELQQHSSYF